MPHLNDPIYQKPHSGRWYIRHGFAGSESTANTRGGWSTRENALKAYARFNGEKQPGQRGTYQPRRKSS